MFPFDLTGPQFISIYMVSMFASVIGSSIYRANKIDNGSGCIEHPLHVSLDAYDAGYLRDGQAGVVDAVVAGFVQDKILVSEGDQVLVDKTRDCDSKPVAKVLFGRLHAGTISAKEMREEIQRWKTRPLIELIRLRNNLQQHGFVLSEEAANTIAATSAYIAAAPLLIAIPKIFIGASLGKPVSLLVLLVFLTVIIATVMAFKKPLRTTRGEAALAKLAEDHAALKTNAQYNPGVLSTPQIALAAALFGPMVFANGLVYDFHKRIAPPSSGGSGCGSSCGGGGGCGGGCGGCGG